MNTKKILPLAVLVAVVAVLGVALAVLSHTDEEEAETAIALCSLDADSVTAGTALTATAKYTAYSVKPITLIVVLYDENGHLTSVQSVSTTTDASGIERAISTAITPKTGDVKAKAFLWNGVDAMSALAQTAKLGF